jgi:Ser-tRNA(Ala) deacylase AlaX
MNLSEDNQIKEIKTEFLSTTDTDIETRKKAFDMLGEYGDKGILTIKDLIGATRNNDIKGYGFEVIARTKKSIR